MSTGHVHSGYPQPEPKHYEMLANLEREPWFQVARKRPFRLVVDCDNPYVAGSSGDLSDIFIDRHAYPVIKREGLLAGTIEHELVEGILELHGWGYLDKDKPAHLIGSAAENIINMRRGITPDISRKIFEPLIKADAREKLKIIPITLDLKPFLDPVDFDRRLLIHMAQRMSPCDGAPGEQGKLPKQAVDYSPHIGKDRCGNCVWFEVEAKRKCLRVQGEIDPGYWCKVHLDPAEGENMPDLATDAMTTLLHHIKTGN